jgi:hypothetical protein
MNNNNSDDDDDDDDDVINSTNNNSNEVEEDDEAMETASNVMEMTTNDSHTSSNNTANMDPLEEEEEEEQQHEEGDGDTMEDVVVESSESDDIAMDQVDEDDDEMVADAAVAVVPPCDDDIVVVVGIEQQQQQVVIVDETMEDKNRPMEDTTTTTTTATQKIWKTKSRWKLSLHDYLALGEVEVGLVQHEQLTREERDVDGNDNDGIISIRNNHHAAVLAIQRLPYMLRLLSSTRPLASISSVVGTTSEHDQDGTIQRDILVDTVVDRLEDIAAMYSVAEGVDVMSNYLARSLTKKISRLKPLAKQIETIGSNGNGNETVINWETALLAQVGQDPISHPTKRKRMLDTMEGSSVIPPDESSLLSSESDDGDVSETDVGQGSSVPLKKRKKYSHHHHRQRHSIEVASEDSQEATFVKTLSDLVSLVVSSLDRSDGKESVAQDGDDDPPSGEGRSDADTLFALKLDDSILAEAGHGPDDGTSGGGGGGGAMEGSDLGSTIADIMHYSPVLRSDHVASAFCRASLPRTGDLLTRIGANCPATVPALLSGCIETYLSARKFGNNSIVKTAKVGVYALANLSHTECAKVYYKLQTLDIMLDVQLKLAMELGFVTISCLIKKHLSAWIETKKSPVRSTIAPVKVVPLERQMSGESTDIPENKEMEDVGFNDISSGNEPTLGEYLANDQSLWEGTLHYFAREIHGQHGYFERAKGQWGLGFQSLALILLVPVTGSCDLSKRKRALFSLSNSFQAFLNRNDFSTFVGGHDPLPEEARTDKLYGIMTSCIIIVLSAQIMDGMATLENDAVEERRYLRIFQQAQRLRTTSKYMYRLWESIRYAMERQSTWDLFTAAVGPLLPSLGWNEGSSRSSSYESICPGLKKLITTLPKPTNFENKHDILIHIAAWRTLIQDHDAIDRSLAALEITKVMRQVLQDEDAETNALSLVSSIDVLRFLKEGTYFLSKEEGPRVPIVSPSRLEMTWSRVLSSRRILTLKNNDLMDDTFAIYVLRLFYCLEFLDSNSFTLFSVDPRSLPLREILKDAERYFPKSTKSFLMSELGELLQKHAPETLLEIRYAMKESISIVLCKAAGRDELLKGLHAALIRAVAVTQSNEKKEENTSELLFLRSRSLVSDADLYSTVMSALLSYPHCPAPRFSYSLLCRDPMVVFRCPLYLWSCRSLRRILLTTLRALVVANDTIAVQESLVGEVVEELFVARDAIMVRCLLAALHSAEAGSSCICSMTGNFVRWLISRRPGLVAFLVKQGLGERDLDWLVEHVPETIRDWEFLLLILGKSCLTAPERLHVADAISRIAIVFGSDSNEPEAAQMTASALSELVDSFYLILGPVGVPVSVLLSDDKADITKVSRKAAFRILKSLTRIRARRRAFRRCWVGLQKLASLCKGESASSGVQGTVATRRKQFLKEVYESASKAVGIACQSPS